MSKPFKGVISTDIRDSVPDTASPVTDDYPGERPYPFTGGTIREAVVDVSGDQYIDLEREALAMMKRQ